MKTVPCIVRNLRSKSLKEMFQMFKDKKKSEICGNLHPRLERIIKQSIDAPELFARLGEIKEAVFEEVKKR